MNFIGGGEPQSECRYVSSVAEVLFLTRVFFEVHSEVVAG